MSNDSADHDHRAGLAEQNARLRQQLAEREAKLAQAIKAFDELAAEQAWLKEAVAALEARVRGPKQDIVTAPATDPAAYNASSLAEETAVPRTPWRHRLWPSLDDFLEILPSSQALYLIAMIAFVCQGGLNFLGERTKWVLLELAGITASLIGVGACAVPWLRKRRQP
jgi:hypothetical protein